MLKTKTTYLQSLLEQCPSINLPEWLKCKQSVAVKQISQLPSKNDEEWRFTSISSLVEHNYTLASPVEVSPEMVTPVSPIFLVFINGYYSPTLSTTQDLPTGVTVGNSLEDVQNYLGEDASSDEVFTALNTAGIQEVAVIRIKKGVQVTTPIHLLHLSVAGNTPSFSQPRVLLILESNSSLTLVQEYKGNDNPYFTNSVTEIYLQDNAQLNHSLIQRQSNVSCHIAKTTVSQGRDSRYCLQEINLGGKLSRHSLLISGKGEQILTQVRGLTVIAGNQIADTHTTIALHQPYGTVEQFHKYIIGDSAQGVFSGKILVPQAAQLTNASQMNRNLLLSPHARINTKPELQITADNVKCSHGATVSQLEAEEIFYLRSRGLPETAARHLLIDGFATEIIEYLPLESLKRHLIEHIDTITG